MSPMPDARGSYWSLCRTVRDVNVDQCEFEAEYRFWSSGEQCADLAPFNGCPGIYQRGDLDERILWICLADPGSTKVRPKEFSYGWGIGRSLLSLDPLEPAKAAPTDTSLKP